MIRTSSNPARSSAARMEPTIPSSMQDGATMSAPLSAWLTAILSISSRDGSLSTSGPHRVSPTIPQWPWSVYSQAQTSVMTTIPGTSSLTLRTACWTTPSGWYADFPPGSFSFGIPKSRTARIPFFQRADATPAILPTGYRNWPGIAPMGRGAAISSSTNRGAIRSFFVRLTSRRSGWIFRDRDLLIRRFGKLLVVLPPAYFR